MLVTNINWTRWEHPDGTITPGRTWNPWMGCHHVSPGCANCYAERDMQAYGRVFNNVVRTKTTFTDPLKKSWAESSAFCFTCSWSDWFHQAADAWRPEAWDIIRRTPWINYLILTKRPKLIPARLPEDWCTPEHPDGWPNVWLGITAENQYWLDHRMNEEGFRFVKAVTKFISFEPLLGPVDITEYADADINKRIIAHIRRTGHNFLTVCVNKVQTVACTGCGVRWDTPVNQFMMPPDFQWGITGGESGSARQIRKADPEWFTQVGDQMQQANIAWWHKQNGGNTHDKVDGEWGGRSLNGQYHNGRPATTVKEVRQPVGLIAKV